MNPWGIGDDLSYFSLMVDRSDCRVGVSKRI